jgi:tight adherence protein B
VLTAALLAAVACLLWPVRGDGPRAASSRGGGGQRSPSSIFTAVGSACRPARRRSDDPWVADFAEVVAVGLDAGLDLPAAALASARSPGVRARAPWLADRLGASAAEGLGVTRVLETRADAGAGVGPQAQRDLALLVAAWRLAEDVGAASSAVTASAATSIRERRVAADRTAVVVAGPRASMVLLSALPLAGPVAALFVGLPPNRLYDSTAARVLAGVGVVLTAAGWWWARGLLIRARRPGRTEGDPA